MVQGADGSQFDSDDIALTRVENGQAVAYLKIGNLRIPLTAEGESDVEIRLEAFRFRIGPNHVDPVDEAVITKVVVDSNLALGHTIAPVGTEHDDFEFVGCPQCERMRPPQMTPEGSNICSICVDWNLEHPRDPA